MGESYGYIRECSVHLYSLCENPGYFGLEKDDIENDDFILKFSVVETIDDKKSVLGCGQYKELELEVHRTQNANSLGLTVIDRRDEKKFK